MQFVFLTLLLFTYHQLAAFGNEASEINNQCDGNNTDINCKSPYTTLPTINPLPIMNRSKPTQILVIPYRKQKTKIYNPKKICLEVLCSEEMD